MPPSRHSSSSHSSRSSSSRSSSRSSGSSFRSSGSSFRSPSSHSSSSYSSRPSRSTGFGGAPSIFRGPSGHSATSFQSAPATKKTPDWRPRVNQPTGFVTATHRRPTYYYGRNHSYAYFPVAWTDTETGVSYEKGYYDETGKRYDDVSFEENGRYRNVLCHCPYCEQDTILDLSADDAASHSLKCPHCGGPMEIRSELDEVLNDKAGNTHVYNAEESLKNAFPQKKKRRLWPILAVLLLLWGLGNRLEKKTQPYGGGIQQISIVENGGGAATVPYGNTLFLEKQADGSYHVVTDVVRADKLLVFDRDADSYYDEATDCWLWYNTAVEPAVWQYWVEGISSDFGDYGWMEYDGDHWYIEDSAGHWIPLPEEYGTEALWSIG